MMGLTQRTSKEQIIDKLLLLYILNNHQIEHDTKAQKTIFFAENSMNEKKIKGFSYRFIRWHFGEFSRELESDLKELKNKGFITDSLLSTQYGKEILNKIKGLIQTNYEIIRRIDIFGDYTESKSLDEVRNVAYTKIMINGVKVKDIPLGKTLLKKLDDSEAKTKFEIDEGWLGTLEILFNPIIKQSLDIAIKEKEYIPFQV